MKRLRIKEPNAGGNPDGDADPARLPNVNPIIESFEVSGDETAGSTVTLHVETDAPQHYYDGSTETEEEYLYTWYTNHGTAHPTRSFGEDQQTQLELPDRPGPIEVLVTVRDGRGGLAVSRRVVNVQ